MTQLRDVADMISDRYPIIRNGLLPHWVAVGTPEWDAAETALSYVVAATSDRGAEALDHIVDAFAQTSIDFLRLQARFLQTGRYARATADGLVDELYADDDEMGGHYLHGLAMTYAMWPNHARLLDFFTHAFVDDLSPAPAVLEIGPGHGLLGHTLLSRRPDAVYAALDISSPALDFVRQAFMATDVDMSHVSLIAGDAAELDDNRIPSEVDALICCEVLEHVDDPASLLQAIRRRLAPDGRAFLSTVANLEAIDHVYLYRSADEIREMLKECGLSIANERAMTLPGDTSTEHIPLNYACIVEPNS